METARAAQAGRILPMNQSAVTLDQPRKKVNRKEQILAAAEQILRERGLAAVTTRAIAEAVPCSEGAIYVHFANRLELILAVLEAALPAMLVPLHALDGKPGTATPKQNLLAAARGLQAFHDRVGPMLCSLFAEADLLAAFRTTLASRNKGPQDGMAHIARYIEAEQKLGRIAATVDAESAAATLMATSFFNAFTRTLLGRTRPGSSPARVVESILG